ncbi:MAG: acetylxylan esterase [Methyloligellaceae bacterium]
MPRMRRDLKPEIIRPRDFAPFWKNTLFELGQSNPDLRRESVPHDQDKELKLEKISFQSLWGSRIFGYFLYSNEQESRPLVVHSHGYLSQCDVQWAWARMGVDVMGVDIRGFGLSLEAVSNPSPYGWILTGWRSPESHILRGAICDLVRAIDQGRDVLAPNARRLVLHGASFAGGLALMAEALIQASDFLCIGVPTFGWAEGRQFFVKSGSGKEVSEFLRDRPEAAEDLMLVLRYFDPLNFAPSIVCPTLVGVGLSDDVVPAETVYALINHIAGRKEAREFPVSHSNEPEEALWQHFEQEWLNYAANGMPEGFGENQST